MSDERKGWAGTMEKVNACGHTNAQHMYYEEKVLELDGAACPLVQAAIQAERERCAKIADDRAKVLMGLAAKESGSLATSLRTAGEELKQLADAIRRGAIEP